MAPTDRPSQRAGQPVDVVGVQVGQHQQRNGADTQPVETPVHQRRIGAGVHHHGDPGLVGGQHHRVALADVAGGEQPAGAGQPGSAIDPGRQQDRRHAGERGQGQRPDPSVSQQQQSADQQAGEHQHARPGGRPRHGRARLPGQHVGGAADPAQQRLVRLRERVAAGRPPGPDDGAQHTDHQGDRAPPEPRPGLPAATRARPDPTMPRPRAAW